MQLRRTFVAMFIGLLFATAAQAESLQETMDKATSGDPEAQSQLGVIYQDGKGVPQDFVQAHAWFNVASANGNVDAAIFRDELAKRMWPNQIARAQQLPGEFPQKYKLNVLAAVSAQSTAHESSTRAEPEAAAPNYARKGPYLGLGIGGATYTQAENSDEKFLLSLGYVVKVKYSTTVGIDLTAGHRFHRRFAA